jgi:hypothetical protein
VAGPCCRAVAVVICWVWVANTSFVVSIVCPLSSPQVPAKSDFEIRVADPVRQGEGVAVRLPLLLPAGVAADAVVFVNNVLPLVCLTQCLRSCAL